MSPEKKKGYYVLGVDVDAIELPAHINAPTEYSSYVNLGEEVERFPRPFKVHTDTGLLIRHSLPKDIREFATPEGAQNFIDEMPPERLAELGVKHLVILTGHSKETERSVRGHKKGGNTKDEISRG